MSFIKKKLIKPIYYFTRMQIIFVPNLLRANSDGRKYIFRIWLKGFVEILPYYKTFNRIWLSLKVNNLDIRHSDFDNSDRLFSNVQIRYINLDHRIDRKNSIETEFSKLNISAYKRFSAIANQNGALGCALSHYELVKTWDTKQNEFLMIFEDDVIFDCQFDYLSQVIQSFLVDNNLDILCLGYNSFNSVGYNEYFDITSNTQTMSCYIVKAHMKDSLISNFSLSVDLLKQDIDKQFGTAIDQVWKTLQGKYVFAITKERLLYQGEFLSDIENKVVNYKV
jgi:glycosyl transferase, family 25